MKANAIAAALAEAHTQYKDQSWKNVVSIGDSEFERLGTKQATSEYLRKLDSQAERDRHVYNVRTKTFKFVERPSVEDLTLEVEMLLGWLDNLIKLDRSTDLQITDPRDASQVHAIDRALGQAAARKLEGNSQPSYTGRALWRSPPQAEAAIPSKPQATMNYVLPAWQGFASYQYRRHVMATTLA
jgi:hypothetical protein